LKRESLTNQRLRAVQFALPTHPVMRTWLVQVNLPIQPQLVYVAGERPATPKFLGEPALTVGGNPAPRVGRRQYTLPATLGARSTPSCGRGSPIHTRAWRSTV
jgi:hypothetical protein